MQAYQEYFFCSFISDCLAKTETITPIDKYVIDSVKRLRLEKQLGQEAIAGMIGVHRTFITNAEAYRQRAKYNLTHINALAFYLDISPQDFLPKVAIDPRFDTQEEEVIKTRKYKKG